MTERLLRRLDEIGRSLADEPDALALLGLGSVGTELDRLDQYSDLDFFVIVDEGSTSRFIDALDWMERVCSVEYAFRNTADGYKLMFNDGIFCEFAVFDPERLAGVAYTSARLVWSADRYRATSVPMSNGQPGTPVATVEHLVGEALTNLYVGLLREHRGERMAALRMIQGYAVDRIMDLAEHLDEPDRGHRDPFGTERRFEVRFPEIARELPRFTQGYDRNLESAIAILAFLRQHAETDPMICRRIERLMTHDAET